MNSLYELNNYGQTSFNYLDSRPAGILFDLITPLNKTVNINQHDSHLVPLGIQITDIIRPTDCVPSYTIDVSMVSGATVSWPSIPSGVTVISGGGVYTVSGFTFAQWSILKQATISLPIAYTGTFTYNPVITWNSTQTKTWAVAVTVNPVVELSDPTDFYHKASQTGLITGNPIIVDTINDYWTITVTPNVGGIISNLSSAGTGSASYYSGGILTITGNRTQVNSHLNSITYTTTSVRGQDFQMIYTASSSNYGLGDQASQNFYSADYISATRSSSTYQTAIQSTITGGPLITDDPYTGELSYTMTVTPSLPEVIANMSDIGYRTYNEIDIIVNQTPNYSGSSNFQVKSSNEGQLIVVADPTGAVTGTVSTGYLAIFRKQQDGTYINTPEYYMFGGNNGTNLGANLEISSQGNHIICISQDVTNQLKYIDYYYFLNGAWQHEQPIQINFSYSYGLKLSGDGTTLAVINLNTTEIKIYTRSGFSWSLESTFYRSDVGSITTVGLSPNGNTLIMADPSAYGLGSITPRTARTITAGSGVSISTSNKVFGTGSFQFASGNSGLGIGTVSNGYFDLSGGSTSNTLEFWVYRTRTGQNESLFDSPHIKIDYTSNNRIRINFINNSGTSYTVINYATSTINTWQHLVLQWNEGSMYLFINGSLVASNTASGSGASYFTNASARASTATMGVGFVGYIDDVRFTYTNNSANGIYSTGGFSTPSGELTNYRPLRYDLDAGAPGPRTTLLLHANSFVDDTTPTPSTEYNVPNVGKIYTWTRSAGTWTQLNELIPPTNDANQGFGNECSLYLNGTKLVIPRYDIVPSTATSAVYTLVGNSWVYSNTLPGQILHISENGTVYLSWHYAQDGRVYWYENNTWYSKSTITGITPNAQIVDLSSDGTTYIIEPGTSAGFTQFGVAKSLSDYGYSFNNTTKVLTLTGNKSQVNAMVDTIKVTTTNIMYEPFTLSYQVTTPTSVVSSIRTQTINHA